MIDQSAKIKILIADDHELVRDGIKSYFEEESLMEVVAEASDGPETLKIVAENNIHVVILDINMPGMDGIKVAEKIKSSKPGVRIIALTMLNETHHIRQMLRAGASGYLLKSCAREELIEAIKTVSKGDSYFSEEVTQSVMNAMARTTKSKPSRFQPVMLTKREKEILQLITKEYSNQDIAEKLFISVRTVEAHKRNLIEKTNSKNIVGLVLYAFERGLIEN